MGIDSRCSQCGKRSYNDICTDCFVEEHKRKPIMERLEAIEKKLDQLLSRRGSHGAKAKSAAAVHDEVVAAFIAPEWMAVDAEYAALFMDYCDHRRELRKYLTQKAVDAMMKRWRGYSAAAVKNAIRNSIESGWQGVFIDDDKGAEHGADWFGDE